MILKGKLTELSTSTIHFAGTKNKIEIVKYDYIDIGDFHERECITSRYLSNFLSKNLGKEIVLSYIKTNMTNSLGKDTITIGSQPKHNLVIGIRNASGKIIIDKEIIDLKGNQSNPITGCLKNLVFIVPVWGIMWFLFNMNLYTLIFMLVTVGGFILFLKNILKKRKQLETETYEELKSA